MTAIYEGQALTQTVLLTPAGKRLRIHPALPAHLSGKSVVLLGETDEDGRLRVAEILSSPEYAPLKDAATLIARLRRTAPNLPPPSDPSWEEILCRIDEG